MFDLESLKKDNDLARICLSVISADYGVLGRYLDIWSVDSLLEKLAAAQYERLKYLPISKLTIFRTSDIGFGYMDYMSLRNFQELIALGQIDKQVPIHLEYKHGNIFSIVHDKDINLKVLLTDETYLMVNEETNMIHSIKIGKPCNPNILYYNKELDGVVSTIDKVATIPNLNNIRIDTPKNNTLF